MFRNMPAKRRFHGFFAGFWLFGSPAVDRPDLRHWTDDLYRAAPQFTDFENFLSDLDFDDDLEDLDEEFAERAAKLQELEAEDRSQQSAGQIFHNDKQRLELMLQQATYIHFKVQRDYYYQTGEWRLSADKPRFAKSPEWENLSLKTLELARSVVNNSNFEGDMNLALLIRLMGRSEHANFFLFTEQFKKKYPNSPAMATVLHTTGEYHFAKKEWDKAEASFKAAMEFKDAPLRPYSVYKLGWLHLVKNKDEKDQAKRDEGFKKAIAAFRLSLKLMDSWDEYDPVFDLKKEALTDLAWTLAALRTPRPEVEKMLEEADGEEAIRDYLYYLAIDSGRKGETQVAAEGLKQLIQLDPENREVPRYLLNISELQLIDRRFDQLISSYKDVQGIFHEENPWFEEFEDDSDYQNLIKKQLANHLAHAAQATFEAAQAMPEEVAPNPAEAKAAAAGQAPAPAKKPTLTRQALFASSKDLYRIYSEWYPNGDAQEEARYNNALSFFHTGDPQKSLELLKAIAQDEKSKYQREATYNAVMVAAAFDQKQPLPKLPEPGKAKSPLALGKSKVDLIERIDYLATAFPETEDLLALQFMAAQTYFDYGHYPEALRRFDLIVQAAPETEQGQTSLHTLLSYQVEAGLWNEAITSCETYLKNKRVTAAGHRKILKQTLQYAKGQVGGG